jgi:hypothetical protein
MPRLRNLLHCLLTLCLLAAGASYTACAGGKTDSPGDDDSAAGDDDDIGDDDSAAADDDDSTPDPENPFPGDSIHRGDYSGQLDLSYTETGAGIFFCTGTADLNIAGSGTISGTGTCSLVLPDGQPMEPEATVSIAVFGEMTDVGNMNDGELRQTMSYAPEEELSFYLDGSASQGVFDLQWFGYMPLPDGEQAFAGHVMAEIAAGR